MSLSNHILKIFESLKCVSLAARDEMQLSIRDEKWLSREDQLLQDSYSDNVKFSNINGNFENMFNILDNCWGN